MKVGFIGGGNMGEAMLAAILNKKLATPKSVTVGETDPARRRHIERSFGVSTTDDNGVVLKKADVVVLAIKPQALAAAMPALSGKLRPTQLVISIVAGARIHTLSKGLKHRRIVRSMPNTPAQIGMGMTVWTATGTVTGPQKKLAGRILGAMGKEIYVGDEKYLDMATAVSGSGPAYFFLFVESLAEAGASIGLPPQMAETLVLQTMLGAGELIQRSGKPPAELRRMVTSPGGTTAEAIARFEEGGFKQLVRQAVTAAYEKAKKLGG